MRYIYIYIYIYYTTRERKRTKRKMEKKVIAQSDIIVVFQGAI